MQFLKYKMMKMALICLLLIILMIVCVPIAYKIMPKEEASTVNFAKQETEQSQVNDSAEQQIEEDALVDPNEHKHESSKRSFSEIDSDEEANVEQENSAIDMNSDSVDTN